MNSSTYNGVYHPASSRWRCRWSREAIVTECLEYEQLYIRWRLPPSIFKMAMSLPVFVIVLVLTAMLSAAQVTPASWRQPNITKPLAERVRLAGAALDTAIDRLGIDGYFVTDDATGTAGDLYAQMALFDMATNQSKYETALGQYFKIVLQSGVNFSNSGLTHPFISDSLAFGNAAAYAYVTYDKDPIFLQYAVDSWWWGREHTLSTQDISAGKFPGMNFTLVKVCQNATMAGGTFQNNDPKNSLVEGYASGYFLVLSALLAEATSDPMYLQAATESSTFIQTQLTNVQKIVQAGITADAKSSPCSVISDTDPTQSGLMLEGLAILSSFTKNASTQNLLNELLLAVIPNTGWQGENGIVSTDLGGHMNLLRGLGAVYSRNTTTPELQRYVGDYIAVQFNAVVDFATSNGTDIYGDSWTGPPSANFSGLNQTDALGALISALYLQNESTSTLSPSAPSPTSLASLVPTPLSHHGRSKIGAIVGGTIGGVVALGIIAAAFWLWLRQRRERPPPIVPSTLLYEPFPGATPSPFIPSTSTPVKSKSSSPSAPGALLPLFRPGIKPEEPQDPPRSPRMRSIALGAGDGNRVRSYGPNIEQTEIVIRTSDLPTERLVRLLNERLQGRAWDEEDTPPGYPVTDSTRTST
ncbi:hypothetical protein B0H16DRAFT_57886 [Mycena metata]|uniref:Glycoside hydrolase family 76 protein n=1 Tax=Mycena metata TaxID=1033252 RepID=A0AAD7IED0_9AGAR|nr:hypothetical protein B0H16DRAFT_57886 [Mycena metata]